MFKNKFLRDNIIVFVSVASASLSNLLYQMLAVRKLSVADFGAFNALLTVFAIASFPVSSLLTMTAKYTSSYNSVGERAKADFFLLVLGRHMFFIGLFLLTLYLVFGVYFKNYLKLEGALPVYLTGAMLFMAYVSTVALGGLQGFERFIWFGAIGLIGAILKLFLAFLFLTLGWGLLGALGALLASQAGVLLAAFLPLKEDFYVKREPSDINLREKYKFMAPSLVTFGCFTVLTFIDVFFVKHFFDPAQAGNYSVAQMIGKIVLFIPGAVYLVMLPRASAFSAQNKDPVPLLKKSLACTAVLCGCVILAYNIFPGLMLGILTGKAGPDIIFLGRIFSVAMAFFSLLFVLLIYQLAVSNFKYIKSLIFFTILQVISIRIFHESPAQILCILLINAVILFAINFRFAVKNQ